MKIRCIAVDDEPLALDKMISYISKVDFLDMQCTFDNAIDAMNYIRRNKVDLVFLDVQMEEFTGIEMLESLREKPFVILTTAYSSYALQGYELDVTDYLLKPISFKRFVKSADKVYRLMSGYQHEVPQKDVIVSAPVNKSDFIFIKTEYKMQKVNLSDILYIEGLKDYLIVKTTDDKILTLQKMKKMEESLPDDNFIRVHKSYIIALNKIETIERNRIKIGEKLIPIGETYRKLFFEYLEKKNLTY